MENLIEGRDCHTMMKSLRRAWIYMEVFCFFVNIVCFMLYLLTKQNLII